MKRTTLTRSGAVCAALLASLAIAGLLSAPAYAGSEVSKQRLKAQLTKQLRERELTPRRILPCRERNGGRSYRCEWRATGTYTGGPGYRCGGRATYVVKGRSWRLDRCLNAELWDMLLERGIQPKAILNAQRVEGGVKYEWRAEGVWPGEVPYRCKNVARYERRSNEWQVGGCENEMGAIEPLSETPGPHPVFGFNENWTQSQHLSQLSRATAIGAGVARFTVSWASVERSRNSYGWAVYDGVYSTMTDQGVRPLFTLMNAPCWAQDDPGDCSQVGAPRVEEIDEYVEFAALLARRYPKALAIEVWNEPNWTPYWAPAPDPGRYARMVRETAQAVHATGTGVDVVVAGGAPLQSSSASADKIAYDEFLRQVFQAGGIGEADAIAHHVYFGDVDDFSLNMRQQIAQLRNVIQNNGSGALPIWITEIGISSSEETDLEGQGRILAELYTTLRRIQNVPVVIVHRFADTKDPLGDWIDHRGVIDTDGNRKPAYCALGRVRGSVPNGC